MSEQKIYQITEKEAQALREALSTCDGDWWVSVRWDETYWEGTAHSGVLFGSDGTHIQRHQRFGHGTVLLSRDDPNR